MAVQVAQHSTQLHADIQDFLHWQLATRCREVLLQGVALNEVHHQVPAPTLRKMIIDAWEVAMKQPTQQVCLALEGVGGLCDLLEVQVPLAHLLASDGAISNLGLLCLVDRPHATLPYTAQDAIAPLEQRIRGKHSRAARAAGIR